MAVRLAGGRQLSREAVVGAAIEMIERSGVGSLSMRSLARHCGTAPMSLYRYIATKEDLLAAVADRYLSEVELPETDGLTWEETVKQVVLAVEYGFEKHTHLADIMAMQPLDPTAVLRALETIAATLRNAGFDDDDIALALSILSAYAAGYAQRRIVQARTASAHERHLGELRNLDSGEFVVLLALGDRLAALDTPAHFEDGLDTIIEGLRRRAT